MRFMLTQHILMALVVLLSVLASSSAQSASFQGLGDLRHGSIAYGVSADGSTVVGEGRSAANEAFIWDATNGMQGLGGLPGAGLNSRAHGVSADGSTVVGQATSASGDEAFIWDATNGMRGIGYLPGGFFQSSAKGVSADGSTVVGFSVTASGDEAFLWDAPNGMQSLQFLLTALGVNLTGWQLEHARGISADGNTIVGDGTNPSGQREAFIAFIPEPGTGLLQLTAMVVVAVLSRRRVRSGLFGFA